MQAYTQAHRAPTPEHGRRIILEAVNEIQEMPDMKHVDFSHVRRLSAKRSLAADGGEAPAPAAAADAAGSNATPAVSS